jgi:HD superfamily phosphohydrolase
LVAAAIIRDPLYEEFELPYYLSGLLSCWEIQRLRYVRLINVNSLPLSALGETSRYSHTLGVLKLGMVCLRENNVSINDSLARLLLAALCLHDAGTPAFGHSMEYILKQQGAGDHVQAIIDAIAGESPTGKFKWSAIPGRGGHAKLRSELRKLLGRNFEDSLITALRGDGPIGHLVTSKAIDLDNIDNVFRMAAALGIRNWSAEDPVEIARGLSLCSHTEGVTCSSRSLTSIERWARVRREVYEILNLHPLNLSGLAMLREAFEIHVDAEGPFSSSAWWTVDSEILENLSKFADHLIQRIKRGDLYSTLLTLWLDTSKHGDLHRLEDIGKRLRLFSDRLADAVDHRVRVHVVMDRGTFERSIPVFATDSGLSKSIGTPSRSIVVSVHSQSTSNNYPPLHKVQKAVIALLSDCFNVGTELIEEARIEHDRSGKFTLAQDRQICLW